MGTAQNHDAGVLMCKHLEVRLSETHPLNFIHEVVGEEHKAFLKHWIWRGWIIPDDPFGKNIPHFRLFK